jgi:hypothetical protein
LQFVLDEGVKKSLAISQMLNELLPKDQAAEEQAADEEAAEQEH